MERSNILLSVERNLKTWICNMFFIMPAKATKIPLIKLRKSFHLGKGGCGGKFRAENCFKNTMYIEYLDYITWKKKQLKKQDYFLDETLTFLFLKH